MKKSFYVNSYFPIGFSLGKNIILFLVMLIILPSMVAIGKPILEGSVIENTITDEAVTNVISEKNYEPTDHMQTKQVRGVVKDENGSPIPGVNIIIKGSSPQRGTTSDKNGEFVLQIETEDEIIIFRYIGMISQEVTVGTQSLINVVMAYDSFQIDEVVVMAYGSQRKGAITGAVSVINAEQFDQTPVASFDQAIQGKVAGVQVTQTSGMPGAKANIKIRGTGSIGGTGYEPLFVIDGIPTGSGDFSLLNPNDIESMSILKDASAASLYGSRAANGVILITTKRGILGETEFTFRTTTGFSTKTSDKFQMMNAREFIDYEILIGRRLADDPEIPELLKNDYSWIDNIFRTGINKSYELSASGGNEKTKFYTSVSYFKQDGIIKNTDIERLNFRMNLDQKVNEKLKFGTSLTLGKTHRNTVSTSINGSNPLISAYMNRPYQPGILPDGSYGHTHWSGDWNIFEMFENITRYQDGYKAMGNIFLEYSPIEGLKLKQNIATDLSQQESFYYLQPDARDVVLNGSPSTMTNSMYRNISSISTTTANYEKTVNEVHEFKVLLGMEVQESGYKGFQASGKTFPSDLTTTLNSAAEPSAVGGVETGWSLISYFSSLNYNYDSKYLLDLSVRRDGSSRFGINNRFGNFWSLGAGWNLHKEKFFSNISFINRLKLRGSIGTSGNFNIGNYTHLDLYGFSNYNQKNVSYPYQITNPDLTWEKNFIVSFGVDYTLFNNRVSGTIDYYNRTTKDLLWDVLLSYTSGFASRTENVGSIRNSGLEFSVDIDVINKKDFNYSIGASISANKNEVIELYDGDDIPMGDMILREGSPINSYYLVEYAGVNPSNGEPLFYDNNGVVTSNYSGDYNKLLDKTRDPDFFGNINQKFKYKDFELSANLYYSVGNYVVNGLLEVINGDGGEGGNQQANALYDSWKNPGDITDIPKQDQNIPRKGISTRELENASFIRLKDVTLSYNLPKKFTDKVKLSGIRIYVKGTNLWTYTKFTGFDPELLYGSWSFDYPPARNINFGLDIKF